MPPFALFEENSTTKVSSFNYLTYMKVQTSNPVVHESSACMQDF